MGTTMPDLTAVEAAIEARLRVSGPKSEVDLVVELSYPRSVVREALRHLVEAKVVQELADEGVTFFQAPYNDIWHKAG